MAVWTMNACIQADICHDPGLNIRLDYCGDPVIRRGEPKKIKFILSNKSKYVTSDRVNVYLYGR